MKFFRRLGLTAMALGALIVAGCQSPASSNDGSNAGPATVKGTITLPADATGKAYLVAINTEINYHSAIKIVTGTVKGSSISYSFASVPAGTYYLWAQIDTNADWTNDDKNVDHGDFMGVFGATTVAGALIPPNVVVPSTGTITKDFTAIALDGSSDATLSALSVVGATLNPTFSPTTTSYTATVANSVASVTVNATPNDPTAVVYAGTGSHSLSVGQNVISVHVFAADASQTEYTITVTRQAPTTTTSAAGSVAGTVTLPSDLTGKFYAVALNSTLGESTPVGLKTGTVTGSSISYSISDVVPGTYYLYAVVYGSATSYESPVLFKDYVAIYDGTFANLPTSANLTVPAGAALTGKNLSASLYCLQGTGTLLQASPEVQSAAYEAFIAAVDQGTAIDQLKNSFQNAPDASGHYLLTASETSTSGAGRTVSGYTTLSADHKTGTFHYTNTLTSYPVDAGGLEASASGVLTVDGTFIADVSATLTNVTGNLTVTPGSGSATTVTIGSLSTGALSSGGSSTVTTSLSVGGTSYTYETSLRNE